METYFYQLENSLIKLMLASIDNLPFNVGKNRFIEILRGSKSSFIIDHELYKLPMYGVLYFIPKNYLMEIIDDRIANQFIDYKSSSETDYLPVLTLTKKAYEFLESNQMLTLNFLSKFAKNEISLSTDEWELYEKLREYRYMLAKDMDLPAYCICGNATMMELSKNKPSSIDELGKLKGVGKTFIEKYGEDFLTLIKRFMQSEI